MAATVQMQGATGASPTWANCESLIKFNLADSFSSTSAPIPIPTTANTTTFSWKKSIALRVTATGSTSISNRKVYMGSSPATGMQLFWKDVAVASYTQSASGNRPADAGSNGATPSGYTLMTTTPAVFDNTSVATSSTGANGDLIEVVLGVDNTYAGGGGSSQAVPSIKMDYDES
jgi:hypothetical protein